MHGGWGVEGGEFSILQHLSYNNNNNNSNNDDADDDAGEHDRDGCNSLNVWHHSLVSV